MRKTDIIYRLTASFLIQAFIFVNACFALECRINMGADIECLSPALSLGQEDISRVYFSLGLSRESENAYLTEHKENGHYNSMLKRLSDQVGTADELLENIKVRYRNQFGRAIAVLEEREKKFIKQGEDWVIEHQKEVMLMSYCMGKIVGLTDHRCARLALGARFHDIGKCEIDPLVINDERLFSDFIFLNDEAKEKVRNEIAEHAARSYDIIKKAGIKDEIVLSVAFYHHANADGSGYPDPVNRQEISLEAKIARVADSFSAMMGLRPYPRPFQQSFQAAVEEIENNVYSFYGPRAVKIFQSMLRDKQITNRYDELYSIPIREGGIFRALLKEANKIDGVYPFAKVACGISHSWNEKPYSMATNSIGTHRHAEINLVLKVLEEHLKVQGLRENYIEQFRRLEFLAYTTKLDSSDEAISIIREITKKTGNPFKNKVIYGTLRPCAVCLEFLARLGIRQIYFASEHYDPVFVIQSKQATDNIRKQGVIIAQAHFPNEGVFEPNDLFFAFCRQPGYEKIADTINNWFGEIINHDDRQKMPRYMMNKKAEEFTNMMNNLLKNLDAQADLEQVNRMLIDFKNNIAKGQILGISNKLLVEEYYQISTAI